MGSHRLAMQSQDDDDDSGEEETSLTAGKQLLWKS
jgi:hypothetical protein